MTEIGLKEYFETQIRALKEQLSQQEIASQRALDLASNALLARFEQVNQFREQVLQERGVFARREVIDAINDRVSRLELAVSTATGRWIGVSFVTSLLGGTIGFVAARLFGAH